MASSGSDRAVSGEPSSAGAGLTPTGCQSVAELGRRRALVAALNIGLFLVLVAVFVWLLARSPGPLWLSALLVVTFAMWTPWTVLGVWNALIGFWLLHAVRDGPARVAPYARVDEGAPVRARVAILLTLRNEPPEGALARLEALKGALDDGPAADRFSYYALSDTTLPDIAAREETSFALWRGRAGAAAPIAYRRRATNAGYKAGNVRDFLERWGDRHDLFFGLDADSLVGAGSLLRLVRIMDAHPRLGILQSLVVGLPNRSAFARMFQFGMRHGMRSYTAGAAWWAGDCGPYWGHNALVRIAPFQAHCDLPRLPGPPPLGGDILSHDQVEAALMRRAGFEVRVLPEEMESYEQNPPHLLEFMRRDLRWCQGNMQYWPLLRMPGLLPLSRFQLCWAILMYWGSFGWTLFMLAGAAKLATLPAGPHADAGLWAALFGALTVAGLLPKAAGLADVVLRPAERARYGGGGRLLAGAAAEFVFSMLLGPVTAVRVTLFMAGLLFRRAFTGAATWDGQQRDAAGLAWRSAAQALWPQTALGLVVAALLALAVPWALWWAAPTLAGLLLAVPFAVATAAPGLGAALARAGLCAIPEEGDPPGGGCARLGPDGSTRADGSAMSGDLIGALVARLGPADVVTDAAGRDPYEREWRGLFRGRALAVATPRSTEGCRGRGSRSRRRRAFPSSRRAATPASRAAACRSTRSCCRWRR